MNDVSVQIIQCSSSGPIELAPIDISGSFNGNVANILQLENYFDFNGDGNRDLLFRSFETPYNLAILCIRPDLTVTVITDFPLSGPVASFPNIVDYDMDGDMDLTLWEDNTMYLNNDGYGNFTTVPFPNNLLYPMQGIVDINGDGVGDSFDGSMITEFDGYGNSVYHYLNGLNNIEPYFNVLIDLNTDGLPEIILYDANPLSESNPEFNYFIYRNNGNFQFTLLFQGVVSNGMALSSPGLFDVDSDGILDLVWALFYQNSYRGSAWTRNNGIDYFALTGHVFVDENNDGEWSAGETGVDQTLVTLEPAGNMQFVNDVYYFPVTAGTYDVTVTFDSDIWFATTPTTYNAEVNESAPLSNDLNFGLRPINSNGVADVQISASNAICAGIQHYQIQVHNFSAENNVILVTATFDPLLIYLYNNSLSEYSIIDNEIQWLISGLPYGINQYIDVYVQYPGTETIGSTLTTTVSACLMDEAFQPISCDDEIWTEIQSCAYDPNDKQVSPAGMTSQGYVENATTLTYTVRFQNTGNAAAQNVVIEDQLSEYLNLSTLEIIAWSHDLYAEIDENRRMRVTFPGIMLPDSLSDPVGSQGFVTYRVVPNADLVPGTMIQNTGEIYFDLNPAIITNTTLNTIFQCDGVTEGGEIAMECGAVNVYYDPEIPDAQAFQWTVNDVEVSSEAVLNIPSSGETNFDVLLEVQLPLCNAVYHYTITIPDVILVTIEYVSGNELLLGATEGPGYTYEWFMNGILLVGETNSTLTINTYAQYTVAVTNLYGCTGIHQAMFGPIAIDETEVRRYLIYPSPALDEVHVVSNTIIREINVFSLTGYKILSNQINSFRANIPIDKIAAGQYFLEILDEAGNRERHPITKM